jgi:hypothetical protein
MRCVHGFERPELTCGPCRDRIARGQPVELEHGARAPKAFHEDPVRRIEVLDDAAVHRGRAPTIEEIREAEKELPDLPPIDDDCDEEEEQPMEVKKVKCTGPCGEPKPLTEEFFYRSKSCKSGYASMCKECVKVHQAAYKAERSKARAKKYTTMPPTPPAPAGEQGISQVVEKYANGVIGTKVLQELQATMDHKVSEVRRLHMAMLTIRDLYGLTVEIQMPRLVG